MLAFVFFFSFSGRKKGRIFGRLEIYITVSTSSLWTPYLPKRSPGNEEEVCFGKSTKITFWWYEEVNQSNGGEYVTFGKRSTETDWVNPCLVGGIAIRERKKPREFLNDRIWILSLCLAVAIHIHYRHWIFFYYYYYSIAFSFFWVVFKHNNYWQ